MFLQELDVLKACLAYRSGKTVDHTTCPQKCSICTPGTTQRTARMTAEATAGHNHMPPEG